MKFIDTIFSLVWDIANKFYQLYYESKDIPIVGKVVSGVFLAIYKVIWSLLSPIANFGDWVADVAAKVSNILSSVDIISLLQTWLTKADNAWDWVLGSWTGITGIVNTWWTTVSTTVQGWISTATEGLPALKVAWGNFFTVTLPTLFDVKYAEEWWKGKALGISALIESRLKVWFPQYDTEAEQQPVRISFFRSPLDWLLEQFTDWFLGKE